MSKSLSWIQTIAKIGKIVCKVVFILSIIGAVGATIGLLSVVALGSASLLDLGLLSEQKGDNFFSLSIFSCINAIITCAGTAIISRLGERYLDHELQAGTPFTQEGAHELFRYGITTIIVSVASSVLSGLVFGVFWIFKFAYADADAATGLSIELGLILLLLSLIFQHGAELRAQIPTDQQEESSSQTAEQSTQETNAQK